LNGLGRIPARQLQKLSRLIIARMHETRQSRNALFRVEVVGSNPAGPTKPNLALCVRGQGILPHVEDLWQTHMHVAANMCEIQTLKMLGASWKLLVVESAQ